MENESTVFSFNDGTWGPWRHPDHRCRVIVDAANLANLRDRETIRRRKLLTLMFEMGDRFLDCIYEIDNSDVHAIKMYTRDDAWLVNARLDGAYQLVFDNLIRIESVA